MERNKLIRLFALLPLATVLTMCTDDMAERGLGYDEAHTPIALNVAFDQSEKADTRAADGLQNTGFLPTYQFLCLFADQNDDNYTQYATTYKPTAATTIAVQSGAAVPYFKAGETTVNVYGWYPALDNDKSFTVQNDQSTQDNYVKSDLLLANKVQSTRDLSTGVVTPATLPFRHVMSKIVLNVTAGDGVTVNNVRLAGVKKTVAINDATKTALTLGSASGDAGEVTVHSTSFTSSSGKQTMAAVIPPQSVSGDFIKVKVTVGGSSRDVTFALGEAKTLATNQTYTLTLTVNKQNIGATLTIKNWAASSTAVNIEPSTDGGGDPVTITSATNATYSDETLTLTYGSGNATFTAVRPGSELGVKYYATSSNTSVVTVSCNESTGVVTVTPVAANTTGSVKIAVSALGTTEQYSNAVMTVMVNKATPVVTPPTAVASTLTYNKSAQNLFTGGSTTGGTLQYALGTSAAVTGSWSTSLPQATNAGTHYVWYKVVGNDNYNDLTPTKGSSKVIQKLTPTITLSTSSLAFAGALNQTKTFTVTYDGDANISINSSNASNASVSPSTLTSAGGTVTVTNKAHASATVTVSAAATSNCNAAANKTVSVTSVANPLASVTTDDIGKVITSDGQIYATVSAATSAGKTAVAMIAYVGNQTAVNGTDSYSDAYNHGLAVSLASVKTDGTLYDVGGAAESTYITWNDCASAINNLKNNSSFSAPSLSSGWLFPSYYQWQHMLIGCGSSATFNSGSPNSNSFGYGSFASNMSSCGGQAINTSGNYWSSTEYGSSNAWGYGFDGSGFGISNKTNARRLRAVFAF